MAQQCAYSILECKVSYNGGESWESLTPKVTKRGNKLPSSSSCGDIQDTYRWLNVDGLYGCDGLYKYKRSVQQVSHDSGNTWYYVQPITYRNEGVGIYDENLCANKFEGHYIIQPYQIANSVTVGESYTTKLVKCRDGQVLTSGNTTGNQVNSQTRSPILTSCTIGDCVTEIADNAFYTETGYYKKIEMQSIYLPNSITSIGNNAFRGCTGLTTVNIPSGITTIGDGAFGTCHSLSGTIDIPNTISYIGSAAFGGCSAITEVIIRATTPPTLSGGTIYGDGGAFGERNLSRWDTLYPIYVPSESVAAYKSATNWSGYTSRIFPIPTTGIKFKATYGKYDINVVNCNSSTTLSSTETRPSGLEPSAMTKAYIGDCVTSISNSAFYMCKSLKSVTISNSVTSIGNYTFNGCSGLTRVNIPSGITSIGNYSFSGCTSLKSVYVRATTPPTLGSNVFASNGSYRTFYVPCESVNAYKEAEGWSAYATRIVGIKPCDPALTGLKLYATYTDGKTNIVNCDSSTSLSSATTRPSSSLPYSSMTSAYIGNCITNLSNGVFSGFTRLSYVSIPNSVTTIGKDAFHGCTSLTSVEIPSSVTTIGKSAFAYCSSLSNVTCLATTPPTMDSLAFYTTNICLVIYVPAESLNAYKTADNWRTYANRIQAIP